MAHHRRLGQGLEEGKAVSLVLQVPQVLQLGGVRQSD